MSDQLSEDLAALRIRRDEPTSTGGGSGGAGGYVKVALTLAITAAAAFGAYAYVVPAITNRVFRPEVKLTEISRVSPTQAAVDLTATGYVTPERFAKIAPKVLGKITKMNVREGDRVKAGQVLFEMDAADQKAAIASAQARVRSAEARVVAARASMSELKQQFDRDKALAASGSIAQATVDDLGARVTSLNEQANASAAEAKAASAEVSTLGVGLHNLTVPAPIDGVVVGKPPELGDLVTPTPEGMFQLVDFASLVIETDVPEARLGQVKEHGPAEIVLDAYPDTRYRAEVLVISPRVNRSKGTVIVKVRFLDEAKHALPDMAARVSFLTKALDDAAMKEPPKNVVPASAIVDRPAGKGVFVVDGETARFKAVTLGAPFAGGFELKDGPAPGTRIVKDPAPTLVDGQAIKLPE